MSGQVGNPEDRFSHNEAQLNIQTPDDIAVNRFYHGAISPKDADRMANEPRHEKTKVLVSDLV